MSALKCRPYNHSEHSDHSKHSKHSKHSEHSEHYEHDHADIIIDVHPEIDIGTIHDPSTDVHDSYTQDSLIKSYNALKTWHLTVSNAITSDETISDVKKYIFKEYRGDMNSAEKAYTSLRTIEKVNGFVSAINANEKDVLMMTWSRINSNINSDVRLDLADNLVELLSDSSINLDNSYCLIGRVTRIVQSLESMDVENIVNITSTDSLKHELSNKVPLLIKEYFNENPSQKEIYENPDSNKESVNDTVLSLKKFVRNILQLDYKFTNANVERRFYSIIDEYVQCIE